eukprot:CAMPEP_0167748794 /NCGR_PEP_ID=MMETSP0110_2-20121227/5039_1 /TAXON_ID=629695 /ORGANISM="Gymnochlora sp., Strain CCMP2014" /LENGTH=197 /DNA_ID=CAMNT_0007633855 /DNA_START=18 /DNA_END=606 /DNA_ORIENTATION=+
MVPKHITFMEKLPLNANGKIDRKALPAPEDSLSNSKSSENLKYDSTEKAVAQAFSKTLQMQVLSSNASFFDLGGDSLSATQLLSEFPSISVTDLFQNDTVRDLARILESSADNSETSDWPQHQLITLQPQNKDSIADVHLVHAAGASTLAYRPLVEKLGPSFSVTALEDNSLNLMAEFKCESIQEVASLFLNEIKST